MGTLNLKMTIFCCTASLSPADLQDAESQMPGCELKLIGLPCSGKVNIPYLVKAFEGGADGVMLVTCKKDECQYMHGGFRAENRVRAVDALIQEIGLGPGRIVLKSLGRDGVDGVIEQIRDFRDKLHALSGPSAASVNA